MTAVFDMAERFLRERLGIDIEVGGGVQFTKPEPPSRSYFDAEFDSFVQAECPELSPSQVAFLERYAAAAAGVRPMPRHVEDVREGWWQK